MIAITITVNSLEDVKAGKPIVDGCTKESIREANKLTIGILEAGMTSGKTSIMFVSHMPDGTHAISQCSAAQFEMLVGAVRGAVQRFEESKNKSKNSGEDHKGLS